MKLSPLKNILLLFCICFITQGCSTVERSREYKYRSVTRSEKIDNENVFRPINIKSQEVKMMLDNISAENAEKYLKDDTRFRTRVKNYKVPQSHTFSIREFQTDNNFDPLQGMSIRIQLQRGERYMYVRNYTLTKKFRTDFIFWHWYPEKITYPSYSAYTKYNWHNGDKVYKNEPVKVEIEEFKKSKGMVYSYEGITDDDGIYELDLMPFLDLSETLNHDQITFKLSLENHPEVGPVTLYINNYVFRYLRTRGLR